MSKRIWIVLFLTGALIAALVACRPQTTQVTQSTPSPTTAVQPPTATVEKSPTPLPTRPPADTPTAAPTNTSPPTSPPTATPAQVEPTPTTAQDNPPPTPTPPWQIPGVQDNDWTKGGENAGLIIVEYADFQ